MGPSRLIGANFSLEFFVTAGQPGIIKLSLAVEA
jgi:hypothetical protein